MNQLQQKDDRYRRAILSNLTHPRLNGRPLELLLELIQMVAAGEIRSGELDRVGRCAKETSLENAVEFARFGKSVLKDKRASRKKEG